MKRVLLVFMLLAACSKAPEDRYSILLKGGMTPEQAKAAVRTMNAVDALPNQAEIKFNVKQKEQTLENLHAVTCQNQPYLRECS